MIQSKKNENGGFTLIELLVVIAIIGILSTIVLASLNSARQKARDATRVSNLYEIRTALEMYYNDKGLYPSSGGGWRGECVSYGGYVADNVIPGLVPTYISKFPSDPSMNKATDKSCYLYLSNGTDYALLDHDIQDSGFSYLNRPILVDPTRDSGSNACTVDGVGIWAWKVFSPGGACW